MQQPVTFHSAKTTPIPQNSLWPVDKVLALFNLPFNDLLFRAQQVHRENFDPSWQHCCPTRPAAARKIAVIARKPHATIFVRTVAVARITVPKACVCRQDGDKLLTTSNTEVDEDRALLEKLGMHSRSSAFDGRCNISTADSATQ